MTKPFFPCLMPAFKPLTDAEVELCYRYDNLLRSCRFNDADAVLKQLTYSRIQTFLGTQGESA